VAGGPAAAAFELPLLVVMANVAGVLPSRLLRCTRRVAIFLIFLFAAVATPSTDPFTMCAMAALILVLFEVAIRVAVVHDRCKKARLAVEGATPRTTSRPNSIRSRRLWSPTTALGMIAGERANAIG
jgi:Sec-independent protein secretion pathway component TatC